MLKPGKVLKAGILLALLLLPMYLLVSVDLMIFQSVDRKQTVDCDQLAGERLSGLYSDWTGVYGTCKGDLKVNFVQQLEKAWTEKNGNSVAEKTGRRLIREYENKWYIKKIDLETYVKNVDQVTSNTVIRWEELEKSYNLRPEETKLVRRISFRVQGVDLVAYSMTELLPQPRDGNWELNLKVYWWLLEKAGPSYLRRLPAKYDSYTSFGPFQFTSKAIYETAEEVRGASKVSQIAEPKIPGSVSKLRGLDHARAAYYFLIHNVARMVGQLNGAQLQTLSRRLEDNWGSFTGYFAGAHRLPAGARRSMKKWINSGMKGEYLQYVRGYGAPRTYVKKAKYNREVLVDAGYGSFW